MTGDGWTLHLGDCIAGLATLADKSIDVTICDPPYEAEAHTLQRRYKGAEDDAGYRDVVDAALNFAAITAEQRAAVAAQIARVTKSRAIVFCQAEAVDAWRSAFNDAGMPYRRAIPWIKPDAMPSLHGRWPGQSYETIVVAQHKASKPCPVGGKSVSYTCTRDPMLHSRAGQSAKAPHPTTKPLRLMRDIVEDFTLPGDLILDPFAGSGTTGVAARMLGRRFIGWELSPAYHAIACRRLNGDEAVPNAAQPSLFGGVQ